MRPALLAMLLLIACKNEPSQAQIDQMMASSKQAPPPTEAELRPILDKYAPIVKSKQEAIEAIAADAKATPPVTAPQPLATPLPAPPRLGSAVSKSMGDTLFAQLERLVDPAATVAFGFFTTPLIQPYLEMIAPGSTTAMQPAALAEELAQLDGVKYALVVRVREHAASRLGVEVTNGAGKLGYEAGFVSGDALFYDLTTKQRLGAFPFRFLAAGGVARRVGDSDEATAKRLEDHLRDSVRTQLGEALATFATGGAAPAIAP